MCESVDAPPLSRVHGISPCLVPRGTHSSAVVSVPVLGELVFQGQLHPPSGVASLQRLASGGSALCSSAEVGFAREGEGEAEVEVRGARACAAAAAAAGPWRLDLWVRRCPPPVASVGLRGGPREHSVSVSGPKAIKCLVHLYVGLGRGASVTALELLRRPPLESLGFGFQDGFDTSHIKVGRSSSLGWLVGRGR